MHALSLSAYYYVYYLKTIVHIGINIWCRIINKSGNKSNSKEKNVLKPLFIRKDFNVIFKSFCEVIPRDLLKD